MPAFHDERRQCHCLTAHLSHGLRVHEDIYTFATKDILRKLFALWPNQAFIGIPFQQFVKDYYLKASNEIAAEDLRKRGMKEQEVTEALAKRICGGCGFATYKLLRDEPETVHLYLLQEAA